MNDYEIRITDEEGRMFIHRTHRLDSRTAKIAFREISRSAFYSIEIWRDSEIIYRRDMSQPNLWLEELTN